MAVFISWSGSPSREVARALHDWLPYVVGADVHIFMSDTMLPGGRWMEELNHRLEECNSGILCVTANNQVAPWLNFEAGAIGKLVSKSYVCPFLFGVHANDLTPPLSQFNACEATEDGTRSLVRAIEEANEVAFDSKRFERRFSRWWPDLEHKLQKIEADAIQTTLRPSLHALLTEVKDRIDNLFLSKHLVTEYRGVFPHFMSDICQCVSAARHELWIACDHPAYASFSATSQYRQYRKAIEQKLNDANDTTKISLVVLKAALRRNHLEGQFSHSPKKWKQILSPGSQFAKYLDDFRDLCGSRVPVPSLQKIRQTPQLFLDAVERFQEAEIENLFHRVNQRGQFSESPTLIPMFLWIADETTAVFSIPRFRNFDEHAFMTRDRDIIKALRSLWTTINPNQVI